MPTLYDEVLYPSLPFGETHPDRLAAIAILFGMDPAPLTNCRVLEVGCGDGENLIPIAFHHPGSAIVGIDAAEVAIRAGNAEIAELRLTNLRLVHGDILDESLTLGTFDYVIAHGFYSWVPEPVRDRLMAIVQASLAPHGVAYISYNALPGGRIREMLREMMLFHVEGAATAAARIQGANQMMQWFMDSRGASETGILKAQVESILERQPECLYHDELGGVYRPVYFQEFMKHAAAFGLQFLSEANYYDMQPGTIPAAVAQQVESATGGDRVLRDQYFDFLKCRLFRRTLLCRQDVALPAAPIAERVRLLHATSGAKPVSARPDLAAGVAEEFRGGHGSGVTTSHPFSKAILQLLNEAWPATIPFPDLLARAAQLAPQDASAENLAGILLATYAQGVIELHSEATPCVPRVSLRPVASELARSQARRGRLITTARHLTIQALDDQLRRLIGLLDGEHELADLVRELAPELQMSEAELAKDTREKLEQFAEMGLLAG